MAEHTELTETTSETSQTRQLKYLSGRDLPLPLRISEFLRRIVDWIGRFGAWFAMPLVLITAFDLLIRKTKFFVFGGDPFIRLEMTPVVLWLRELKVTLFALDPTFMGWLYSFLIYAFLIAFVVRFTCKLFAFSLSYARAFWSVFFAGLISTIAYMLIGGFISGLSLSTASETAILLVVVVLIQAQIYGSYIKEHHESPGIGFRRGGIISLIQWVLILLIVFGGNSITTGLWQGIEVNIGWLFSWLPAQCCGAGGTPWQIWLRDNVSPFFDSTLLQEFEWHSHTILFALVLGFGYIWNTHVRVDLVRENLGFKKKAWLEFIGLTFFLVPFTMIIIFYSYNYAYDSWNFGRDEGMLNEAGEKVACAWYQCGEISASLVGLSHRWIIKGLLVFGLVVALIAGIAVWLQTVMVLFGPKHWRYDLMTLEWPEDEGSIVEGKERMDLEKLEDQLELQSARMRASVEAEQRARE